MYNRYRVKLGNFTLGWIVETELTVRYISILAPIGEHCGSVAGAMDHFWHNLPESARKDLTKELMTTNEAR